jgi:hypothetical protein
MDVLRKQMQSAGGNRICAVQRVLIGSWGNKMHGFKKGLGQIESRQHVLSEQGQFFTYL